MEKNFLLTCFTKKNILEYSIIRLLKEFPEDVSEALLSYYYMGEAAVMMKKHWLVVLGCYITPNGIKGLMRYLKHVILKIETNK